ncbi:MAG TPA: mannosyltransferase family protein [Chloroflexota bacterium]|nr:mannosyltransferase family protein [Chloroflexota bacterium]HUM71661.1 mannosyltransferase family protein [Chloroflexota bacterium]
MAIVIRKSEEEQTAVSRTSSYRWDGIRAARWFWLPVVLFTATRLGILLVAYLSVGLVADAPGTPPYHLRGLDNRLLDVLGSRWDTGFYVSIAEEGYFYEGVPLPSVAFFPLYPLLMRAVTAAVGDALVAGILISNAALLLASILFYRLVSESWDEAVADRAIWYWLIFPAAFFGTAVYSESLFLLCAIGSLYFARRGYWEVGALLGIGAALTRLVGIIVAPVLLLEWWRQWRMGTEGGRPSPFALLVPLVVPLGTLAYVVYLWRAFGDPLAFVHGAAAWARQPQSPLLTIAGLLETPTGGWWAALLAGNLHLDNWIDLLAVLLFAGLGLVLLYWRRWPEATFVLLGVGVAFSSGLLMSQRRYMWALFPAFIVLAKWGGRPWLDRLVTAVSLMLLGLFTALFANGYWVG